MQRSLLDMLVPNLASCLFYFLGLNNLMFEFEIIDERSDKDYSGGVEPSKEESDS